MTSDLIARVAKKAVAMAKEAFGIELDQLTVMMDLEAVHMVNPLDLEAMLEANPWNMMHDIAGIGMNLNRVTGKLENCFLPRHTKN